MRRRLRAARVRLTAALVALLSLASGAPRSTRLDPAQPLRQFGQQLWQTDNGLPQNTVHAIHQTARRLSLAGHRRRPRPVRRHRLHPSLRPALHAAIAQQPDWGAHGDRRRQRFGPPPPTAASAAVTDHSRYSAPPMACPPGPSQASSQPQLQPLGVHSGGVAFGAQNQFRLIHNLMPRSLAAMGPDRRRRAGRLTLAGHCTQCLPSCAMTASHHVVRLRRPACHRARRLPLAHPRRRSPPLQNSALTPVPFRAPPAKGALLPIRLGPSTQARAATFILLPPEPGHSFPSGAFSWKTARTVCLPAVSFVSSKTAGSAMAQHRRHRSALRKRPLRNPTCPQRRRRHRGLL